MLTNKDDLTVVELKSFLQSHLGKKSSTELFQDLMCAKQHENETPQQLYKMIWLKQRIMFTAKHTTSVVQYDASAIQCIFLNTICQEIGEKYEDVRCLWRGRPSRCWLFEETKAVGKWDVVKAEEQVLTGLEHMSWPHKDSIVKPDNLVKLTLAIQPSHVS